MRLGLSGLSGVVLVSTLASPAFAVSNEYTLDRMSLAPSSVLSEAPMAPTGVQQKKNPGLALALSAGAPFVLLGLGAALQSLSPGNNSIPSFGFAGTIIAVSSPIALGAGQMYAGDPLRGVLVGLGGPLAVILAFLGGAAVPVESHSGGNYSVIIPSVVGAVVLYEAWALYDAHQTTVRINNEP